VDHLVREKGVSMHMEAWRPEGDSSVFDGPLSSPGEVEAVVTTGKSTAPRDVEFAEFFTAEARAELARTAWLLTGDVHRAEELVQMALLRTYVAWPAASQRNPLAYARRVMSNARIDSWRRLRREVLTPPALLPHRSTAGAGAEVDDRDEVVRALATLPVRLRRVVVLRYMLGLTEREVSEELGIAPGTVKSQSSKGLRRLRNVLTPAPEQMQGEQHEQRE